MKTIRFLALAACVALLSACNGNNNAQQQQQVPVNQAQPAPSAQQPQATVQTLPEAANAFIAQHFPDATVTFMEHDSDDGRVEYEASLSNGTKVTFNANGDWDKVECYQGVPTALVPAPISNYVSRNYQGAAIVKIDREYYGYEIDLANGLDLKFNANGQLMSVDD